MTRTFAIALAVLALTSVAAPVIAKDVNLNVYPLGLRSLEDDVWDDLDIQDQVAGGGTVDFGEQGWPVHFAIGVHGSIGDEDTFGPDVTGTIGELSFGVAKVWTPEGNVRPFISGGFSFVSANLEIGNAEDDDDSAGLWIEGGVYWRLTSHFNLGLYGRVLEGTDITLFGGDTDVDYFEVGPMIGWSWPGKK